MTGTQRRRRALSDVPHRTTRRKSPLDVRSAAGCRLLAGIDAVLPLLTVPPQVPAVTLAEDLRIALAHTAAHGDTCLVCGAAQQVRLAAELLRAGATEEARQALRDARSDLVDPRRPAGSQ